MRTVICHYHIYKNSGTTFDGILATNFGARHVCFDGPFPYFSINQDELGKIIQRNPRAAAFSSHQIILPAPASLDINVLPVVFVRHPLLRILSIYKFKRAEADGTETSRYAMEMNFQAWCRHALSHAQELTHVSNAQVRMLGRSSAGPGLARRTKEGMLYDINQARRNLRNVELLARTEHFARDVSRFPILLADYGIEFRVGDTTPRNVTASDFQKSVEQRLVEVAATLDGDTMEALLAANRQDLALYEEVCDRLDAEPVPEHVANPATEEAQCEAATSSCDTVADPSNASSSSS